MNSLISPPVQFAILLSIGVSLVSGCSGSNGNQTPVETPVANAETVSVAEDDSANAAETSNTEASDSAGAASSDSQLPDESEESTTNPEDVDIGDGASDEISEVVDESQEDSSGEIIGEAASSGDTESTTVDSLEPAVATLELIADKTFRISWQSAAGAEFYRVLENPDGTSGFSQIGGDLDASTQRLDHRVALYSRVNARYMVQACDVSACVDSDELVVSGTLESAVGYIKASNADGAGTLDYESGDSFGRAVSLSADGSTLAIGAIFDDSSATGINGNQGNAVGGIESGAVYVFVRRDSSWQQQAYVKASNTGIFNYFGEAVSLSADGNTLAVGASGQDYVGAAYVFVRNNDNWSEQAHLKPAGADPLYASAFGASVSLSSNGNTLAIGAFSEDGGSKGINGNQIIDSRNNISVNSGAAYVFERSGDSWQQKFYLKASNADEQDRFGKDVFLSADGNTLAVGAIGESSSATGLNGDQGNAVNSSGNLVCQDCGAVYIFVQSNGAWQQQAYIKASNTGQGDEFGRAVGLSADGNTLAVGAALEGSSATGVDGYQFNNNAGPSGAVYMFTRSNASWEQQAYIKASESGKYSFGYAISLSVDGNTMVVGAPSENSGSTGINGLQDDSSSFYSGAAYVFVRSNSKWRQQAYIKASNTDAWDGFGFDLSLSANGDTLAIASPSESSAATGINGNQQDNSAVRAGAVYLY